MKKTNPSLTPPLLYVHNKHTVELAIGLDSEHSLKKLTSYIYFGYDAKRTKARNQTSQLEMNFSS